jgi:hypothetical protein
MTALSGRESDDLAAAHPESIEAVPTPFHVKSFRAGDDMQAVTFLQAHCVGKSREP